MEWGAWGQCGEFQLLVLRTAGTVPYLVKPHVRPELTSPCPHLITLTSVCSVYMYGQEDKTIITVPILQKGKLRLWQGT